MPITGVSNKPVVVGTFSLFSPDAPFTRLEGEAANVTAHLTSRNAAGTLTLHYNSTGAGDAPADGDAGYIAVVVSELDALPGEYIATFTPPAPGNYSLVLRHAASQADIAEEVRVDTVTLTDVGGYSVVPITREVADVGAAVDLVVRFVLPDGTRFDPYELRQVVVTNADTDAALFTIGAGSIARLSEGTYRVRTPVAIGESMTLADRWFFRAFAGNPESTRGFSRVVAQAAAQDGLLITVERLKRNELAGVRLTLDDGTPFSDETFVEAIREAQDYIAGRLDLPLVARTIEDEVHDYRRKLYVQSFGHFQLRQRPILEVVSVKASYPNIDPSVGIVIPTEWVTITNPMWGQFNLVPSKGTLGQYLTAQSAPNHALFGPLMLNGTEWWPGIFHVKYRAGFEADALPPRIASAIGLQASLRILDIAGDLIAGAGIANVSHSIGGLSSSIGTTSSATNHGYGAKRKNYEDELKKLLPQIRAEYHGTHQLGVA